MRWALYFLERIKNYNDKEQRLFSLYLSLRYPFSEGNAVAQWLRWCATNRKVAGSIPASVNWFFIDVKYFRSHYGSRVRSASNRNEYQEYFLGVTAAGAYSHPTTQRPTTTTNHIQQNQRSTPYAVTHGLCSSEDGHNDARNMLRQKLIINI